MPEIHQPFSEDYQDVFYSRYGGWDESRHVFLRGNSLPEAWAGRTTFRVGELGFGTGLNLLALVNLWKETPDPKPRLEFYSLEKKPWSVQDLLKVHEHCAPASGLALEVLGSYTALSPTWFTEASWGSALVVHREAQEALSLFPGKIDAWFLDGFAPSKNSDLWSEELLALVGELTTAGGTCATYTAAGLVKRNLRAAGFEVFRLQGWGPKRHMVRGRKPL